MSSKGTANSRRLLRIFRRDGHRCFWCSHPVKSHRQLRRMTAAGRPTDRFRVATVDHVQSRDEGGTNDLWNLVASCSVCNVERSRPGNAIDIAIVAGKYALPPRPRPLPPPKRARPDPKRKEPAAAILDQSPYVQRIPWTEPPSVPGQSGLYLVVEPGADRVLLVPVIVEGGEMYVAQGQKRPFKRSWKWCALEDMMNP